MRIVIRFKAQNKTRRFQKSDTNTTVENKSSKKISGKQISIETNYSNNNNNNYNK